MIHLRAISIRNKAKWPATFPFTVPIMQSFDRLDFSSPVTFFVGDNGSGKSTLLEAIACAANLPTVGSESAATDPTLKDIRQLSKQLRWEWTTRVRRGFFLRSEDFFGYAKRIEQTRAELQEELANVDVEYAGRSQFTQNQARLAYANELNALKSSYGDGLDVQSHGESYFKLFQARFVPNGLYLLDEPEAPLSPMRQLSLISMLKLMIDQQAQFIIATHSPILLAYPNATIYQLENGTIQPATYDELEHVTVTRTFLNNPEAYLRHLI
ncbi:MAG: AAA family ATPase [Chloroflexota bacterium]